MGVVAREGAAALDLGGVFRISLNRDAVWEKGLLGDEDEDELD